MKNYIVVPSRPFVTWILPQPLSCTYLVEPNSFFNRFKSACFSGTWADKVSLSVVTERTAFDDDDEAWCQQNNNKSDRQSSSSPPVVRELIAKQPNNDQSFAPSEGRPVYYGWPRRRTWLCVV
jgi:hypothetical protein